MSMPPALPDMPPLAGVDIATFASGIGYAGRPDIFLARFSPGTQVAGVLTRNALAAAPVIWTRQCLAETDVARALIINAGNANCYTGPAGTSVVSRTVERIAGNIGCAPNEVLVCSTGSIGQPIDTDQMEDAISSLIHGLSPEGWPDAARAIMTTDRWPKAAVRQFSIGGSNAHLYGISKGTSMIAPDMATTISAVFTDAHIPAPILQKSLQEAADASYNCISVDQTMSTNDSLLAFATGKGARSDHGRPDDDGAYEGFKLALRDLLHDLALQLLADARKDGKLLAVNISGAETVHSARNIGRRVCQSMMVQSMVRSGQAVRANGLPTASRVIAAIGGAGESVASHALSVRFGDVAVAEDGCLVTDGLDAASRQLQLEKVALTIDVGTGSECATIWTIVSHHPV